MGKDCLRNLSIGYGCKEREHLGILIYNGRLYNVHRENFVCKGNVSKSCEEADKVCLVFEGQIYAPPTVAFLEIVTKVIFCPLVWLCVQIFSLAEIAYFNKACFNHNIHRALQQK